MPPLSFQLRSRQAPAPSAGSTLRPRAWQSQLLQLLRVRLLEENLRGTDVLVHAGPGAGKTLGALLAYERLRREGRLDRLVVFCHRTSIASQWQQAATRLGLTLQEWSGAWPPEADEAVVISYQAAARQLPRLQQQLTDDAGGMGGRRWMAIADEVHHLGLDPDEPEASAWGHAFSSFTAAARLRLGLSGTPFRADNLAFCAARRIQGHEDGEPVERIVPDLTVQPRQLIVAGDVRPLEFRFQDGWVQHGEQGDGGNPGELETSPLSAESRESWRARNLRRAIRIGDPGGIAMRLLLQARRRLESVRREHASAGGIVIARDIHHARSIAALLREQGDGVRCVHSQDPEAADHLSAFRAGEGDWLVSIDMCAEGFDAPRLRVVAYLTTVVTRCRFLQAITRAVRIDAERAAVEPIPRQPSFIYAPADPLLMGYARHWSLSPPYVIRGSGAPDAAAVAAGAGGWPHRPPLQAVADGAGRMLEVSGPELPRFLRRGA
ncbi:MAG: DEAD/DEAH box helicase family protein [Synechococcaceae cyanobacterium]|nr:DEAD/DEAH box helicase family protein [Synechococcaceae cyanobacterium]